MQNKTSKRLFGTKINSKNCNPPTFQNNSTTFASEYITHLLFIISTSPSISAKIGGISFTPETFPRKNFRKIFYINQSFGADFFLYFRCEKLCFSWGELFSTFMARKIMGMKGTCRSANRGGGVPSFMPFLHMAGASVPPAFILSSRQFSAYRGKFSAKKGKSK